MATRQTGKQGERLLLVEETRADRQTIEMFELITRKMRIGRVPVLFKALAAEKALGTFWNAIRPAVRLRAFEEAADDLRVRAAAAAVDLGCPLIETQLEHSGYDLDEIDEIRGQVNIFHYQDPKLLMAAAVMLQALNGGVGGARATQRGTQRVPRGVPQDMDPIELVPEDSAGPLGKSFKSIRSHLMLGVVPDDFRALGRWPKYLDIAWQDARKRDREARAKEAVVELGTIAEQLAQQLPVRIEVTEAMLQAAGADLARVRTLLTRFRRALPGLVLDLALFKVQLDGAGDSRESPFPIRWKYIATDDYMELDVDTPLKLRAGDPTSLDDVGVPQIGRR